MFTGRVNTLATIEAALSELKPDELEHVDEILQRLRLRASTGEGMAELERRNGFDPLPDRHGGVVTVETVRQLCAEEGI